MDFELYLKKNYFVSDFRRPSIGVAAAAAVSSSNKSNAETQTALRGVSIVPTGEMKIFREIDKDVSSSNSPSGNLSPFSLKCSL